MIGQIFAAVAGSPRIETGEPERLRKEAAVDVGLRGIAAALQVLGRRGSKRRPASSTGRDPRIRPATLRRLSSAANRRASPGRTKTMSWLRARLDFGRRASEVGEYFMVMSGCVTREEAKCTRRNVDRAFC